MVEERRTQTIEVVTAEGHQLTRADDLPGVAVSCGRFDSTSNPRHLPPFGPISTVSNDVVVPEITGESEIPVPATSGGSPITHSGPHENVETNAPEPTYVTGADNAQPGAITANASDAGANEADWPVHLAPVRADTFLDIRNKPREMLYVEFHHV